MGARSRLPDIDMDGPGAQLLTPEEKALDKSAADSPAAKAGQDISVENGSFYPLLKNNIGKTDD